MLGVDSSLLGILFTAFGLSAMLVVFALLKAFRQTEPLVHASPPFPHSLTIPNHSEAILIVLPGGRLAYLNQNAREWFNAWEDVPSLERLCRRTHPSADFLGLCTAETQARLSIEGAAVEAKSYAISYAGEAATLVSIRRSTMILDGSAKLGSESDATSSSRAIQVLNELNEAMAASLDLEKTIQAILENIQRLIPSDFPEISVWHAETGQAVLYRLTGSQNAIPHLEKINDRYTPDSGFSGYLISQRKPFLVPNLERFGLVKPAVQQEDLPINSYVGVPLQLAGELIGTLELASLTKDKYSDSDLELLQILSGPASIALHNAILYGEEQQRARVLAGLAKLAQAVRAVGDSHDLFSQMVESIAPILDVEILGFMIYDEDRRTLQGQPPYFGLHKEMLEYACATIQPGSPAEEIWMSQQPIIASEAPNDLRIKAFELDRLALAASLEYMVLAPLASGGRMLGYLLAGDKRDGTAFNQDDLRLLSIIAGQASSIVENAFLMQQAERRRQRAETLRRIASLTGSSANLDEVLKYSILDLARLLKADHGALFLLDDSHGELRIQKSSLYNVPPDLAARLGRISLDDPQFQSTATSTQSPIFSIDAPLDQEMSSIYKPLYSGLNLRSLVIVPLIVNERGIGEIVLGSQEPDFFIRSDLQTVMTAAGLLANIIERKALYSQTDETLRRRVDQLTALTRVGRELNATSDLQHLCQRVYEEAIQITRADCGSIVVFDVNGSNSKNDPERGGNGFGTKELLHLGDNSQTDLLPLERHVLSTNETLVIDDFNPDNNGRTTCIQDALPAHDGIRSELIVPIPYQEKIAGLIHLHASTPGRFDQAAVDITEALAIQASVALGSAYRYQEQMRRGEMLNRRVETLAHLLETSQLLQSEQPLEQALENIATAMQSATQFDTVLVSIYNAESGKLFRTAAVGIPDELKAELWDHPLEWEKVEAILDPEYRIGRAYFIPFERMPVMPADIHTVTVLPLVEESSIRADYRWHPEDMLLIPLYNSSGDPLGMISVDSPRDHLRPDTPAIEALEVFSGQAALVIENHLQMAGLNSRMQEIQGDLRRAEQAAQMAQSHLPVLLHKDLEQTLAVQSLSQRAKRIRAGMDIAEIVNRQGDRSSVLLSFGREILTRMEMDLAVVVEPAPHGPHLLHSLGRIPPGINVEALIGQRNPLHQSIQLCAQLACSRIDAGSEWAGSPLLQALEASGFICLPILIGSRLDAALLLISQTPLAPFTIEDEQLFTLLSRQVSVTLQNLDLLTEISQHLAEVNLLLDFNRQLSNLEPDRILQTLVESSLHVLPAAQASLVTLWDEKQKILAPRAASGYKDVALMMEITYQAGEALPGITFEQQMPTRLDEIDFPGTYNLSSENLLRYHKATGGRLPVSCLAVPIQRSITSVPLGVLVLENYTTPRAFSFEAQALVTSLTQQTALNLENARLYRAAEQRASQLEALTGVSATISSNLKPDQLIESFLDQLQAILPYRTGTLWLRQGEQMIVRAARGFVDSDQRAGLSVAFEDSALLKEMIATGQPILVGNVNQDPRFSSLVENPYPSWLGIPLIASGEVRGVIALEMEGVNFYTLEHVQIATAFAAQAAVALENAGLYQESVNRAAELDQRSRRLERLNQLSKTLSESLDPEELMGVTVQEILQSIHCSGVSGLLIDPHGQASVHIEMPLKSSALPLNLPEAPLFSRLRETLGVFNCENIQTEEELAPLAGYLEQLGSHSLLALSLATGNELHGVLFAYKDHPYRFTADEIGLARTISNQAAVAIQNARLYAETRSLTNELDQRVKERTEQLARAHQRTETLLSLMTELSTSLDLEQVLNRTISVLNQLVDAEHITVLLAHPIKKKLRHLASVSYGKPINTNEHDTTLASDQGLAGWIIREKKPALIPELSQDQRWITLQNDTSQYRSAIGVPLLIGGEALGALLFFHRSEGHFSNDEMDLLQAAANQVAIAVNNAELYRLIRDQAEDLGNMVRSQQVETQRSKAILEDVADGVLVTDENMKITLFNDSAEKILGLSRQNVIGKSMDDFTGIFGGAAGTWMDTIQTWSKEPSLSQAGNLYSGQITLDDKRVVSVHLAPVSLQETFLGTVSVFRDITHQVEINRLKSEFVATVSHELRTPMTSIKGYVDILLMGAAGSLNDQQTHFLEIVKSNTDRLSVLVNDLLDISRIESGRLNLAIHPVDLSYLAEQAVDDLIQRTKDEDKPMEVELDLPRKLPRVAADPEQLRHILQNLLENAFYYTPENGHISLKIRQKDSEVQVDVKDDGIGIPANLQSRVFERFYRGENPYVLSTSGTGLGLSIVQNLVEMHKGRLWLKSSGIPGEGSTFSFTVPVYIPE